MLTVDIYNKTRTRVRTKLFTDLLRPAEKYLAKEKIIMRQQQFLIELTLIGESQMRALNQQYHNKNRPTDVISLSYFLPRMHDPFVGEIFICIAYARKQAREIRQSLSEEVRFLFIHGLLHIFGYDHEKPEDAAHMKKAANLILGR